MEWSDSSEEELEDEELEEDEAEESEADEVVSSNLLRMEAVWWLST